MKISGATDAMQIRGKMQLHETFFTPVLTNVRYELSETPLEFTESGLSLDGLTLRDPYDKTLEINGKLNTKDWTDIQCNLTLHADRWQASCGCSCSRRPLASSRMRCVGSASTGTTC